MSATLVIRGAQVLDPVREAGVGRRYARSQSGARYIDDIVHPGMLPLTPGRRYAVLSAAGAYR